jgi:hypothetical protein
MQRMHNLFAIQRPPYRPLLFHPVVCFQSIPFHSTILIAHSPSAQSQVGLTEPFRTHGLLSSLYVSLLPFPTSLLSSSFLFWLFYVPSSKCPTSPMSSPSPSPFPPTILVERVVCRVAVVVVVPLLSAVFMRKSQPPVEVVVEIAVAQFVSRDLPVVVVVIVVDRTR